MNAVATSSWSDRLLGTDPRMRDRTLMCLLGGLVYLVWFLVMVTFAIPQQRISAQLGLMFGLLMLPGMLLFYPLVRSGWTQRFADPGLMSVQMLWGCLIAVVAYATVPTGRAALLQTMGLALVFGFMSLSPQAALRTGAILVGMLLVMLVCGFVWSLPAFRPAAQAVKLLSAAFIMGLITLQSRKFALLRERIVTERRELAAAQSALERVTRHDALTGLLSRQYGQERLDQEHQRAKLSGRPFGVVQIDLDHFKQINDQHSHQVGDEVLMAFAQAAREVLRDTDLMARWGGEEFLLILPDTQQPQEALQALERLQAKLGTTVVSAAVPSLRISFSAGYALWAAPEDVDILLQRADRALYAAKHAGRRRCVQAA
ncbi:GGDEF domain-containing protein [Aquabacterium sp. G14]|uniref:GGDEF domain-containing protein n=1 Tax=Aquabacterium sp. G14 TaxID=3130164 RepID=UPI0030A87395